jgi:alpha-glucosidase
MEGSATSLRHYRLVGILTKQLVCDKPGWAEMTTKWKARGTRVLTYMSPFFSDPSAYSNSTTAFRHNFFSEGVANGYFVQNSNGSTYLMYSLSIKFAMLDLTNPAAVSWMQDIIINQSVEEAGSSGWMCDFGEYLPFDAVLHSVSDFHAHLAHIIVVAVGWPTVAQL